MLLLNLEVIVLIISASALQLFLLNLFKEADTQNKKLFSLSSFFGTLILIAASIAGFSQGGMELYKVVILLLIAINILSMLFSLWLINSVFFKKEEDHHKVDKEVKYFFGDKVERHFFHMNENFTLAQLLQLLTSKIKGFAPLSVKVFEHELPYGKEHLYTGAVFGVDQIVAIKDANGNEFKFPLVHGPYIKGKARSVEVTELFSVYPYLKEHFPKGN